MGKIQKIKADRKKAEVEAQIKKMKRNRRVGKASLVLSLVLILFGLGFWGFKYSDAKWGVGSKINTFTTKYLGFAKEEKKMERKMYTKAPDMQINPETSYQAVLKTTKGDIKVLLNGNEVPNTVNNFVTLSRDGFYEGTVFHRIIKDFMIQGGDPQGTGSGGPGYRFDDEPFSEDYLPGTVAMANSGANTNGSQFFIMTGDYSNGKLPKNYTIFGKVINGMDVVEKIAAVNTIDNGQGETSKPTEEVKINSIEIIEN